MFYSNRSFESYPLQTPSPSPHIIEEDQRQVISCFWPLRVYAEQSHRKSFNYSKFMITTGRHEILDS